MVNLRNLRSRARPSFSNSPETAISVDGIASPSPAPSLPPRAPSPNSRRTRATNRRRSDPSQVDAASTALAGHPEPSPPPKSPSTTTNPNPNSSPTPISPQNNPPLNNPTTNLSTPPSSSPPSPPPPSSPPSPPLPISTPASPPPSPGDSERTESAHKTAEGDQAPGSVSDNETLKAFTEKKRKASAKPSPKPPSGKRLKMVARKGRGCQRKVAISKKTAPSSPANPSALKKQACLVQGPKLVTPRTFDFTWLESVGCSEFISAVKKQKWFTLLSMSDEVYPHEVREFYRNVTIEDGLVVSVVRGIRITLNARKLGTILGVPCAGYESLPSQSISVVAGMEPTDIVRLVTGNPNQRFSQTLPTKLFTPYYRLLCAVAKVMTPRLQGRGVTGVREIMFTALLHFRQPINLPCVMIEFMKSVIAKPGQGLPYGLWLTKVFTYFGISLDASTSEKIVRSEIVGAAMVDSMGLSVVDGHLAIKVTASGDGDRDDRLAALEDQVAAINESLAYLTSLMEKQMGSASHTTAPS